MSIEILAYRPLVRRAARRFAPRPDQVEDFEQEAWLALLLLRAGKSPRWAVLSRLAHVARAEARHSRKLRHPLAPQSSRDDREAFDAASEAEELMAALPPRWARALTLRHGHGLPWADVGREMGVKANTAREFGWRGVSRLRSSCGAV